MKRMSFYVIVLALVLTMGYILHRIRPQTVNKLLSIDTEYSYLMEENREGSFLLFINSKKHELTAIENYARILLKDHGDDSLIELSLFEISLGDQEIYMKESFYRLSITFLVPVLQQDWIFDDAYLVIELKDQKEYELRLGRVSFYHVSHDEAKLSWTSLSGIKRANDLRSRLYLITIDYEGELPLIEKIDVGTRSNVTFYHDYQKLFIELATSDYLLYDVPIVITYQDGSRQTISNFLYVVDYVLLKESGPMINVYTLD